MPSGISLWEIRGGLGLTANKLNRSQALTVAFIGGSVTAGEGATLPEATSYRGRISTFLMESFPNVRFRSFNAAIGGTDSTFGAYRLHEHLLEHVVPDLLFVEFAVNDAGNATKSVRAMEGIVRQALKHNPLMDIVFVYTASRQGAELFATNRELPVNIKNHEAVASHYGLPSVHIARVVYEQILAGTLRWEEISGDSVHPNDDGYSLYASMLADFLRHALADHREEPPRGGLPAPIDPLNDEYVRMLAPWDAQAQGLLEAKGWRIVHDWTADRVCNWVPPETIYLGDAIDDEFRLRFDGTAVGVSILAGMDTGDLAVSIDHSPFEQVHLFDPYCERFYRPKIAIFAENLAVGMHTLTVKVSDSKAEKSQGMAIRIMKILIKGKGSE